MNLYIENHDRILTAGYAPAPFMLDYRKKLPMAMLTNYLIHTAELHAMHNGFGVEKLHKQDYSWVLIRLAIEMKRAIHGNANLHITTWIERISGITTLRCFELRQDEDIVGYASTIWSAIDLTARTPVRLTDVFADHGVAVHHQCPIAEPARLRPFAATHTHAPFEVGYSSMDLNRHLNSTRYMERCFDALPLAEALPADGFCRRVVINFHKEALHGERLEVRYAADAKDPELYHLCIGPAGKSEQINFIMDYHR